MGLEGEPCPAWSSEFLVGDMTRPGTAPAAAEPPATVDAKEGIMGESEREGGVEIMLRSGMDRGGPAVPPAAAFGEDMLGRGGTDGGLSGRGDCEIDEREAAGGCCCCC